MGAGARREATIRTLLIQRAGSASDTNAIIDATVDIWRQMATRLAPVIGARGVDVIFSRALHQTSSAFPWLAIAEDDHRDIALRLASLKAHIAGQDTATVVQGSSALLSAVTELLASLIGEPLTARLLDLASPPASPPHKDTAS
ncbi:MAG: hypothetical protein ACSLFJ_05960 [Immundisolibacter sp.]|uniref:hypothetical protein n=1 Tax=Immundisolibacter sp. TaxID=1934948 RepID=UPI003EE28463